MPTRRRPPHKIDQDVPYQDVKPPISIQTVTLSFLKLHISYDRVNRDAIDEIDTQYVPPSSSPLLPPSSLPDMQLDDETQPSSWTGEMEDVQHHSQDIDGFSDCFILNDRSSNLMSSSPMLPAIQHSCEHETSSDADYPPSIQSLEGDLVSEILLTEKSAELVMLIDHAFRRLLQAQSRRTDKNISVDSTGIQHHLCSLAPAVCVPGYITAVAAQAVFIQRCAKSLNSIRKRGLQHVSEPPSEQSGLETGQFERSLWQILDRTVAKKTGKTRLKPIEVVCPSTMLSSPVGSDIVEDQQEDVACEAYETSDGDFLSSDLETELFDELDLLED